MPFSFHCSCCGQTHEGMPSFGNDAPLSFYAVPEAERAARCRLDTNSCVIDGDMFFVRGCIEIAVAGEQEPSTDHPLAMEQREGIPRARVEELFIRMVHPS